MLMLLFHLGDGRYAVPVSEVVEVAPNVHLDVIAGSPDYIAGLLNYRGEHVPVVDLCHLVLGRPCRELFTTRIVLVEFTTPDGITRPLGLLAERVTNTREIQPEQFTTTGLNTDSAPYLGQAAQSDLGLVQYVSISQLLPASVVSLLYTAEAV